MTRSPRLRVVASTNMAKRSRMVDRMLSATTPLVVLDRRLMDRQTGWSTVTKMFLSLTKVLTAPRPSSRSARRTLFFCVLTSLCIWP